MIKSFSILFNKDYIGNEQAFVDKIITHDLLIISQDTRPHARVLLDMLRAQKPDLPILGYVQTATQDWHPASPHAEVMRDALVPWPNMGSMFYVGADNRVPIYDPAWTGSSKITRLLHDYRLPKWQEAFKSGIAAMLADYAWDGLFLDNCTVWRHYLDSDEDAEDMAVALSNTITDLSTLYPQLYFVGNGRERWDGTNGGMLETAVDDLAPTRQHELDVYTGQQSPPMQLFLHQVSDMSADHSAAHQVCTQYNAWLGLAAGGNYNSVYSRTEYGL